MNKQKYLISNAVMGMMLIILALYQFIKISNLTFLEQTSQTNDIGFILISILLMLVVVLITYYLPMYLVFELSVRLSLKLSPINHISFKEITLYKYIKENSRVYLRFRVIRC